MKRSLDKMPTYEYYCIACAFEFEEFQSIAAEPIKYCPRCKKQTVARKISGGGGLIFKGSGFYITDYKKKSAETTKEKPKVKSETKLKDKSKVE
jgi:putative FmdB family regulatory protein